MNIWGFSVGGVAWREGGEGVVSYEGVEVGGWGGEKGVGGMGVWEDRGGEWGGGGWEDWGGEWEVRGRKERIRGGWMGIDEGKTMSPMTS